MSVYIEPLIVENFVLDYVIAATSYRILRIRRDRTRFLCVAMLGCVSALFYPFFGMPIALAAAVKILLSLVLSAILFCGKCGYAKGAAVFCFSAFVFGGFMLALCSLKYGSLSAAVGKPLVSNGFVTAVAALALYAAVCAFGVAVHRRRDISKSIYGYSVTFADGKTVEGMGLLDTGNRLYDNRSGLPVVVMSVKNVLSCLDEKETADLLTGHAERVFEGARKMRCKSIGGAGELWVIRPEKFEVYSEKDKNILYDVMVGLSFSDVALAEEYDAILHPALAEVF